MDGRKTRFAITALAACALAVIVVVFLRSDRDPISKLRKAMAKASYRTIEPRLSGGFAFRPYRTANKEQPSAAFFQAAMAVGNSAQAQAVVQLLRGNVNGAIARFEEIPPLKNTKKADAIHSATDEGLLNDYAAALYERAVRESRPLDLIAAYTAANRAVDLSPDRPEPRQIRALILENLNLREDGADAWRDYLQHEENSAWAAEGREHLARLTPQLHSGGRSGPQEKRVRAEETLLGNWGAGVDAAVSLAEAKTIGQSLAANGGDQTVARCVYLVEQAVLHEDRERQKALADAHAAYQRARLAFARARDEHACDLLSEAAALLDRAGSPLAFRAHIYAATIDSYFGRNEKALGILKSVIESMGDHANDYPVAAGQAHWTRGLIHFARGGPYQALRSYETAAAYMQRTGETSNIIGVEAVLAEVYRYLGDADNAWIHQVRALQMLSADTTYTRRQIAMTEAAFAAIDLEFLDLAELLTRRLAATASAKPDPIFAVQAAVIRARIANIRHQSREAMKAIADAEKILATMPPTSSVARLIADVAIFRAEATMSESIEAAVFSLETALGRLRTLEHTSRLPRIYLLLGQSQLRRNDRASAERAFLTGIEIFEAQRGRIETDVRRSTFTDTGRALYDATVRLLVDRGDTGGALKLIRRARAMASPSVLAVNQPSFPPSAHSDAHIEYYLLPDALLTWVTSRGQTKMVERRGALPKLVESINRASDAISETTDAATAGAEAARAYDLLIRPIASLVSDGQSLFIAPDGVLHRVPFAALVDVQSHEALIERHPVTIVLGSEPPATSPRYRSILVVAPPPIAGFDRLASTVREAQRAAASFPNALVLDGTDATPTRMLSDSNRFDIVHFAGHALWNERAPDLAALRLSPDADARDGALRAFEVGSHHFRRTNLVVLAACDTGRGRVVGPGLLSFARTFVAAGVPRVVGSLWPVDDESSARLFTTFYDALGKGAQPAEALRSAQRKAIASGLLPCDWAMFQLYTGGSA